jgi:hypothetical protein
MSLKAIVRTLASKARTNESRAYQILGAKPGPGLDLLIRPVEPLCGKWFADGLTRAGKAFVAKFWPAQPLPNNLALNQLKREADDWQLKYQIRYPIEPLSAIEDKIKGD